MSPVMHDIQEDILAASPVFSEWPNSLYVNSLDSLSATTSHCIEIESVVFISASPCRGKL